MLSNLMDFNVYILDSRKISSNSASNEISESDSDKENSDIFYEKIVKIEGKKEYILCNILKNGLLKLKEIQTRVKILVLLHERWLEDSLKF